MFPANLRSRRPDSIAKCSAAGIALSRGPGIASLFRAKASFMTLDQAKNWIKACAEQMHVQYQKVVFDEWAIVSLAENKGRILAYIGPRKDGFLKNFPADASALRAGLLSTQQNIGDFEFNRHGVGTSFESFMVIGEGLYLICNNTVQTMDAIAKEPRWLSAQVSFVELCEKFRQDPLVITE
jgi:hypothetical protein